MLFKNPFVRFIKRNRYPIIVGSAVLTGTIVPDATEAEIVTGGQTLIITLTGNSWVPTASFDAQRQNIIDGVTSAQSEATGWNLVPKALQSVTGVVRTSETVVTITWDAFITYDITANETITVTVPASAVTGGIVLVATPTFDIIASGGVVAYFMGRMLSGMGL